MKEPDINNVIEQARGAINKWEIFASKYDTSRQSTHLVAAALANVRL